MQVNNDGQIDSPHAPPPWQDLLDAIPAGAYVCDASGLITYYNGCAKAVWGREPKLRDPDDRYCGSYKLYQPDGDLIRHDQCYMALALNQGKRYSGLDLWVERPDGHRVLGTVHVSPLHDGQGQMIGALNLILAKEVAAAESVSNQPPQLPAMPQDAILAMIELALAVLTCGPSPISIRH